MKNTWHSLSLEVSPERIVLFRILFALVLLFQVVYFYHISFIEKDLIEPVLHFPFISAIPIFPPLVLKSLMLIMLLSSIMMILGYRSRIFSFIYLICFTYLWLLDKGYYNNHYYLISLLLFLMCLINSDVFLSIKRSKTSNQRWEEMILLFQFSLVLLYAGFNKMNVWWLIYHEPVHHILLMKAQVSSNPIWNSMIIEFVLVWGGFLFDLLIVPMLLWSKTRKMGILLFFVFNGINTWLFYDIGEIGIFPLLMLSSLVLFIPRERIKHFIAKIVKPYSGWKAGNANTRIIGWGLKSILLSYVLIQLLLPLRHHLMEGNVDYTGEGQRFSWRMKSVYKDFSIAFRLEDEDRDISAQLDPRSVLTIKQYTNLGYYPELIIPVAENLREAAKEKGVKDPKIYVEYKVGFMGLAMQYMIDPDQELKELKHSSFRHSDWILPLNEH